MFGLSLTTFSAIQRVNAQAMVDQAQQELLWRYAVEQMRQEDKSGAVNLVLRDGVYVLPEQIEYAR